MRYKTTVLNEMKIELGNRRNPRFNTTKQERKAMKSLKKNQDIIIKPADKGVAIIILNKEDYIKEGMRQLSNTNHYKELEEPEKTIKRFIQEVKESLDRAYLKDQIREDLHKILSRPHPRTSNLYLLPKIIIIIIIISFIFLRVHQLFCNIADTVSIRINNTLSTQMVHLMQPVVPRRKACRETPGGLSTVVVDIP